MNFLDVVSLAVSNLWRRKLRTALTVLGVIIGTACIVIMVALGIGNMEQYRESIMQNEDLTLIQVYGGWGPGAAKLNESTVEQFKAMPGVKAATGLLEIPSYLVAGKYVAGSSATAVDPAAMSFEFSEGGVFSDTDALELVMGLGARQWFTDPRASVDYGVAAYSVAAIGPGEEYQEPAGPDVDWLEQPLKYYPGWSDGSDVVATPDNPAPREYKARIAGLLTESTSQQHYSIYMSIPAAKKLIRENRKLMDSLGVKEDAYTGAYVTVQDIDSVQPVLDSIRSLGFEVYSPTEWITQVQEEQSRQQSQLIAIGLVSLLVSAIGIANTMLASILERKREIGVMKVIGLSIGKINLMFLVEAAMIGLVGGLVGLAISYIMGGVVNTGGGEIVFLGMYFSEGVRLSIPWWLSLGAVLIATGVGIVSGIYPALQATKMSPLEAIRAT